ncbi:hypothetical protein QYF36_011768 [Acer negundo]|nr:hypothetical protein QYF36_011768 [Acer negundo]
MSQRSLDDPNTYSHCPPGSNNTASGKFMYNLGGLFNRKLYDEGGKSIFYNTTEGENPNKVYGNYICRFDYSQETCQNCVIDAINSIVERCNGTKEAIAWYTECMVRYSDKNFFATLETVPTVYESNTSGIGNVTLPIEFPKILNQTFTDLLSMAPANSYNCATLKSNISNLEPRLYSFAQCTPDLSSEDCRACLKTAFDRIKKEDNLQGKHGGRVFIPSCFVRYELYQFYGDPIVVGAPVPISPPQGRRTKKDITRAWILIAIITASAVFVMVMFSSFVWCMWRRHNKRDKEEKTNSQDQPRLLRLGEHKIGDDSSYNILGGEKQTESQDLSMFPLSLILKATQNFFDKNKLGEGGFGSVYKGILVDDFGMARIFGGNQSEANTNRVVGTYGYMAPEYAMEGLFSIKSDVFSFGVLLLEIFSGKKNGRFYHSEYGVGLINYTWNQCDSIKLAQPTQPAFSVGRLVEKSGHSASDDKVYSNNEVTISNVSPR